MIPKHHFRNGVILGMFLGLFIGLLAGWLGNITTEERILMALLATAIGAATGTLVGMLFLKVIIPNMGLVDEKPREVIDTPQNQRRVAVIEYELSVDDVVAFFNQIGRVLKSISVMAIGLLIVVVIVALTIVDEPVLATVAGVIAIVNLLYLILRRNIIRMITRMDYSQGQNRLTGRHKLSIAPDEVTDITDAGESKAHWSAVKNVVSTKQHLFILVRGSGPYIVPRRAFNDESEYRQFGDEAKAYHQAASVYR
jgi:hypothetical protein